MRKVFWFGGSAATLLTLVAVGWSQIIRVAISFTPEDPAYRDVEEKLVPQAVKLGNPQPGEWLAVHKESGQTFKEYLWARPVRRSPQLRTIYIRDIGTFSPEQRKVLDLAKEYLGLFYDASVKTVEPFALDAIPA